MKNHHQPPGNSSVHTHPQSPHSSRSHLIQHQKISANLLKWHEFKLGLNSFLCALSLYSLFSLTHSLFFCYSVTFFQSALFWIVIAQTVCFPISSSKFNRRVDGNAFSFTKNKSFLYLSHSLSQTIWQQAQEWYFSFLLFFDFWVSDSRSQILSLTLNEEICKARSIHHENFWMFVLFLLSFIRRRRMRFKKSTKKEGRWKKNSNMSSSFF